MFSRHTVIWDWSHQEIQWNSARLPSLLPNVGCLASGWVRCISCHMSQSVNHKSKHITHLHVEYLPAACVKKTLHANYINIHQLCFLYRCLEDLFHQYLNFAHAADLFIHHVITPPKKQTNQQHLPKISPISLVQGPTPFSRCEHVFAAKLPKLRLWQQSKGAAHGDADLSGSPGRSPSRHDRDNEAQMLQRSTPPWQIPGEIFRRP